MQIVIDISEDMYHDIIDGTFDLRDSDTRITVGTWLNKAVPNSTVLPDGHGDLIDRNQIEYLKAIHDAIYGHIPWSEAIKKIRYSTPTIIEADKVESDG